MTLTARLLSVLVINPNKLKVNSVAELIDQAKREFDMKRSQASRCQIVPRRTSTAAFNASACPSGSRARFRDPPCHPFGA